MLRDTPSESKPLRKVYSGAVAGDAQLLKLDLMVSYKTRRHPPFLSWTTMSPHSPMPRPMEITDLTSEYAASSCSSEARR